MRSRPVLIATVLVVLAVPGATMSNDDQRDESLTVYGEPVRLDRSTEEPSPETVRELSEDEVYQLKRSASRLKLWSQRYPHEKVQPGQISPAILDFLWFEWLADEAPDRPASDEAIRVLGAALGHLLTAKLGMRWVQVTDRYGTDICVRGSRDEVTVCPSSAVAKRVERRDGDFFGAVFEVTKQRLAGF